jgi:short-subunit dehydrogenase
VLGATSAIGRATARRFAAGGTDLVLVARSESELGRCASDLRVRTGVEVVERVFDALATDALEGWWQATEEAAPGGVQGVVLCWGDMPEQLDAQRELALARRMIDVNYTAAVVLFECAARGLEARGEGFLCALSSVAGDRGRASNYLYGSTKAALSTFLSGLRARLAASGVAVVDVRPGFVDSSLTFGRPGVFLAASPDRVAGAILRAVRRRRSVVYTPFFWRWVMAAIRAIPEPLFQRLAL